jgi:tetratricopeptide (TPR) repeat protein
VELNHSELSVFEELISIFAETPEELFKTGNREYEIGSVKPKASYITIAIKAYREALKITTVEKFPMDYAIAQNNIGTACRTLAKVEERALNCKKAIGAYKNALRIYTEDSYQEYNKIVAGNIEKLTNFCKMNEIKL